MIAVDTNILVYAHREDSSFHDAADTCIAQLAESGVPFALPWPCLHEFLAIVTHPRIYKPPTPLEDALEQVECWLEAPGLILLGEHSTYWAGLKSLLLKGQIAGPQVHDARIAALCLLYGVKTLWTADRDFSRFGALKTKNPLLDEK